MILYKTVTSLQALTVDCQATSYETSITCSLKYYSGEQGTNMKRTLEYICRD